MSTFVDSLLRFLAAACPYDAYYIQHQLGTDEDADAAGVEWVDPPWLRQDDPPMVG